MVAINLDKILKLTAWAIEMEREIEVLCRAYLLVSLDWRSRFSKFVFQDSHDLAVFAYRAKKEKIIALACPSSEFAARYRIRAVIGFASIE